MEQEERMWIEEAIQLCKSATDRNVTLVLVRHQDANDEGDYVLTNATDPKLIAAMMGGEDNGNDT